jgi:PTH1 family peptidyl-tRNA hydrolase
MVVYNKVMKLIFAQGNPGTHYDGTRHNSGFFMVDRYVREHGGSFTEKAKYAAHVSELSVNSEKVLVAKPTTFYNETGRSARAIVDFYKLDPSTDVLVIHDELALPFGTVRTRSGGSDAGNNGIKSLNATLGQEYKRIRIGIYNELRDRMDDIDFVIGKFSPTESEALGTVYGLVARHLDNFIAGNHIDETLQTE